MKASAFVLAAVGAVVLGGPACADSVPIMSDGANSTEGLGSFVGSIDYSFSGTFGTLTIMLTNSTDPAEGGFITGFLFDIGGDATAALADASFGSFEFIEDAPAPPFSNPGGNYDAGAALGGNWTGGGNPTGGIGVGETGVFEFQISGPDAPALSALSFIESADHEFGFVVRFRGLESGSDKVPGTVIPLPAPVALGAVGLLGVIVGGRRARRSLSR